MKKKILFVANIHKHFRAFHIPYIEYLKSIGYEVHVAANDSETQINEANKQFNIPINRNPFSVNNVKAIRQLEKIIEKENYCLIHCHTAMGSVVARIAARKFRLKGSLKVLYTAHGFHFYKGSPIHYWLSYYPVEIILTRFTDAIITINDEDYQLIKKHKSKNCEVFKIPGIGVNKNRFNPVGLQDKIDLRRKNGFQINDFILVYAAEFIHRKNHDFIIDAAIELKEKIPNVKILFAGRGELIQVCKNKVLKLNLSNVVHFLGFRNDIDEVFKMADIGISSSRQEGLGLNLIEEMMCELPILATQDRGHKEIVTHGENGFLFAQGNKQEFIKYLKELYTNEDQRLVMGTKALNSSYKFEVSNSLSEMSSIYKKYL